MDSQGPIRIIYGAERKDKKQTMDFSLFLEEEGES
jgi:hypothetical protein